jgi:hypothetical protein
VASGGVVEVFVDRVVLLTGERYAVELNELLMKGSSPESNDEQATCTGKWRNIVRRTDYVGSWIFAQPKAPGQQMHQDSIDVACLDPPSLRPEPSGTLAPLHYHSDWWQDPFPGIYADGLMKQLKNN